MLPITRISSLRSLESIKMNNYLIVLPLLRTCVISIIFIKKTIKNKQKIEKYIDITNTEKLVFMVFQ